MIKRIKHEEIQTTIQNYVRQRNINKNLADNNNDMNTTIDLSLMALNDLSLIESSLNDYYSYSSFSSFNQTEYINQFEKLKKFILEFNSFDLKHILFPLFVYLSIDLILVGFSIKNFINNNFKLNENKFLEEIELNKEEISLIENLISFNENKDINKFGQIKNWIENKYRFELKKTNWNKLIEYLINSKLHLLVRLLNNNFQIITSTTEEDDDDDDNIHIQEEEQPQHQVQQLLGDLKKDDKDFKLNLNLIKQEIDLNSNDFKFNIKSENIETDEKYETNTNSKIIINLKNLNDCIQKIQKEPSKINGTCCYYVDDLENEITSSCLSPNSEFLSYTSENSSIYLYKLYDNYKNKFSINNNYKQLYGGHTGAVFNCKFSHDSKHLLSCGEDGLACLWNLDLSTNMRQSNLECTYSGHLYPVWNLDIFSKLNLFTTCSKDGTARLWSFDRLYPLRVYCGHQSDVNCVEFHPNASYLATGSSDKTVRLWSVQTSEFVRLFSGHRSRIFSITFSPDGNYLASAGEDKKIKIWDLRSGGLLKELKGHNDIVYSLKFDNNSEMLLSGGLDKTLKIWDVHSKNVNLNNSNNSNNSPNSNSNNLIKSINLNFNIYSINCDVQNVFYINGAKKILKPKQQLKLSPINENLNKNAILNESKSNQKSVINNTNNKMNIVNNNNDKIKQDKKMKLINTASSSQATSSSGADSRLTRRRAAIASSNTTQSTNQQLQQPQNNFNFLKDNDDLYEC